MTPPLYRPGMVVYASGCTASCHAPPRLKAEAIYVVAYLIHRSFTKAASTSYRMADGNDHDEIGLHPTFEAAEAAARASLT